MIAICSKMHIKYTNTICWKKVKLLDVKPGGTYV